jgi:hypothetical protein
MGGNKKHKNKKNKKGAVIINTDLVEDPVTPEK